MTVGDLKRIINTLPEEFAVRLEECKLIRTVSIEPGALVLCEHVLTVNRVVDTFTAHDGTEYNLAVSEVKYPKVIQMPQPVTRHQCEAAIETSRILRQLDASLNGPNSVA